MLNTLCMHPQTRRLHEAIRRALDNPEASLTEAAAFLRLPNVQTLKNWETRGPSAQGVVDASLRGISSRWIELGVGPMLTDVEDTNRAATADEARPAYRTNTCTIPLLENSGSMGSGTEELHNDVIADELVVSRRWLRQRVHVSTIDALRLIHAYGDSMAPTMRDGDILLVDTGLRNPGDVDGVYVLRANQRLYIKRVRKRMSGELEVSSDNPTVKTVDVLNGNQELDVIGRVVWVWNGVAL